MSKTIFPNAQVAREGTRQETFYYISEQPENNKFSKLE